MDVSFVGHDGNPDDPIYHIPTSQADHRVLPGAGYGKDTLEDLQLWAWLTALAFNQIVPGPVGVRPGTDSPDRILAVDGTEYPLELTVLTVQQLRTRLGGVRKLARLVHERLHDEPSGFVHLAGRTIVIAAFDLDRAPPPGTRRTDVAEQVVTALREDRGFMGDNLDSNRLAAEGLPTTLDLSGGDYGEFAGLKVRAERSAVSTGDPVTVVGAAQAEFRLIEAQTLVKEIIAKKDVPENRILLISAGAPDSDGFACPLDFWLFDALWQHGLGGRPHPAHLDCVVLQAWGKPLVAELYRRPGAALPWPPPTARRPTSDQPQ